MKVFIIWTFILLMIMDLKIIQVSTSSSSTTTTTTTTTPPTARSCDPGQYPNNSSECALCEKGFYKASTGNESCIPCPNDLTTLLKGSTSNASCTNVSCDPGQYPNNSSECALCEKGFYKASTGNENCIPCPNDLTTLLKGSTSNASCTNVSCGPGQYPNSSSECALCEKGFYKPSTGNENCIPCPNNLTTLLKGSTSNAGCTNANSSLKPKLLNTTVIIRYELFINTTFNESLGKNDSEEYNTACDTYGKILQGKFRNETGVTNLTVKVTGFTNGSLIVEYEVILPILNTSETTVIAMDENLHKAATDWKGFPGLKVDIERTKKAIKNTFIQKVCQCEKGDYICVSENKALRCEHKCDSTTGKYCRNNGHCVNDTVSQKAVCLCSNLGSHIFYGEHCEYSMLKTNSTTTTTTKIQTTTDPFPVSKLTIIAISGGTGGALLLIILISTICFCYRLKHANRKGSFSETSSKCDSDIIRDNKKMERIPLESGKLNPGYQEARQESGRIYPLEPSQTTKSNPLYRDDFGDHRKWYRTDPEPRYQDHDRISRGSFNPQTSNDRLRTESSGNRQPVKQNYNNDSEPSYRDQRESENSYRPRGFSSERNNPRGRPEEISRDRNNSRGWSEESNNDRNKPIGRSEESNGERNNTRRWPEENSNDRNYPKGRSEESSIGDDRYVYIEGDGGVRRLFKRVDDKELGGETLIYQPSNMPRPIQRENVDSVGDNFIMRPAPSQDDERRRSFYDTIDSENPYKIQRPIIKHNNLYS